jgi:hypothetical protein
MAEGNKIGKLSWLLAAIVLAFLFGTGLMTVCCAGNGEQTVPKDMPNSVMEYIKQNHPDAAPFIKENIPWTARNEVLSDGYSRDVFTGGGWKVVIGHTITAKVIYGVTAEYSDEGIVWVGAVKDGTITEESYTRS